MYTMRTADRALTDCVAVVNQMADGECDQKLTASELAALKRVAREAQTLLALLADVAGCDVNELDDHGYDDDGTRRADPYLVQAIETLNDAILDD